MERLTAATSLTTFDPLRLAAFARHLQAAELHGSMCVLDFSDQAVAGSARPSAVRLSIPSVMVVSNLLVGRFRDVPVAVQIPETRGLNLQLARGGFFYALANRPRVSWAGEAPEQWSRAAKAWVHPFHPSDAAMRREALVDVKDPEHDSWVVRAAFQRYLLSVMHPHNRPARHLRHDLRQVAGRWLSSRLHVKPGSEMVGTLTDCLEVFYQIVVNVPDHASLRSSPAGCSLGQVYATLGGGRESHNRLHFTVLDNGVGLPRRVSILYKDRARGAEEALRDAVMGPIAAPGRRARRRARPRAPGRQSVQPRDCVASEGRAASASSPAATSTAPPPVWSGAPTPMSPTPPASTASRFEGRWCGCRSGSSTALPTKAPTSLS